MTMLQILHLQNTVKWARLFTVWDLSLSAAVNVQFMVCWDVTRGGLTGTALLIAPSSLVTTLGLL